MTVDEVFERIAGWEAAEISACPNKGTNKGVNEAIKIKREWDAMRVNAMKVAFNAEQFNRRAAWMRNTGRNSDEAAAMFPVSEA
jgi:hypothetical protein